LDTKTTVVHTALVVDTKVIEMSDTFHLHNRGSTGGSSISMTTLEESARDRKNQLESIVLQLKKMVTHLYSITDEEIADRDISEE